MKNNRAVFLLALIFGLLAATGVYWYIDQVEQEINQISYIKVLVPKENIPANTPLTRSMFKHMEIPQEYLHIQAVTQLETVDGAITKTILVAGEQLLKDKLVEKGSMGDGLAYQIKAGYRAVTIPINLVSGVAGLVKPGDTVDIIATLDVPEADAKNKNDTILISTFLLQDILVLAADSVLERKSGVDGAERKTLTLEIKPNDAPKLVLASERGTLRLLLRSPIDQGKTDTPPAKLGDFKY